MPARCLSLTLSLHARTVCSSSQGFACKAVSTVLLVHHGAVLQGPALVDRPPLLSEMDNSLT